ncbi:MAG: TIGR02588 family protein [Gemmatimonadaceae bacterium]|nr:TIGR02588 family protein [Gloeobacterales cyanobacterium ES-bin-141]
MNTDRRTDSQTHEERKRRTPAEWVTFMAAALILSGIVGLVLYDWLTTGKEQPPVLTVARGGDIREVQGQFYVPFSITNTGQSTAESVQIVADLRVPGVPSETGELQIDFLSDGETEEGAFIFSRDPKQGILTLRVASYKTP